MNPNTVDFLDTTVFFMPPSNTHKTLHTKVFFKSSDTHSLLHKTSFHPKHTFKGIVKSQLIRFHRICSFETHFEEACQTLFQVLRTRGYSKRFLRHIKSQTLKSFSSNVTRLRSDPKHAIPLITTFNNHSKILNRHIKHNFHTTQITHIPLQDFAVVSAYRKNKNLKDSLVRADLKTGPDCIPPVVSQHFFQPRVQRMGSKAYILPTQVNLNTKNVVYLINCTHCNNKYIGETHHSLQTRLKQHLHNIQRQQLDTPLVRHFKHIPITHFKVLILESNITWSTQQRKRRETTWIKELHTTFPKGFNIK